MRLGCNGSWEESVAVRSQHAANASATHDRGAVGAHHRYGVVARPQRVPPHRKPGANEKSTPPSLRHANSWSLCHSDADTVRAQPAQRYRLWQAQSGPANKRRRSNQPGSRMQAHDKVKSVRSALHSKLADVINSSFGTDHGDRRVHTPPPSSFGECLLLLLAIPGVASNHERRPAS